MAAPALTGTASGAAAGAPLGPIGAAVGAAVGFLSSILGNNDNAVISARDKIVIKFRANTLGAKTSADFPIKKSAGGTLFSQFNLEHSQIDDRKIGGNYDKEWKHVCEFAGTLLWLMYPNKPSLVTIDFVNLLQQKEKPDHAFAKVVDFAGPSYVTTEQLRVAGGLDSAQNVANDPTNLTANELANNNSDPDAPGGVPIWYWIGGAFVLFFLFGRKLLKL